MSFQCQVKDWSVMLNLGSPFTLVSISTFPQLELNSNKIAVCKGAPKSWNLQLNFILMQENVAIPTDFITLLCLAFPMSFWRISYVSSSSVRTETYSISPSLTFLTQQFFPCSSAECASIAVFSLMLVSVPLHEYISIYSISY